MESMSVAASVRNAVEALPMRSFVHAKDYGATAAAESALSRLCAAGEIRRVRKGLYWKGPKTPLGMPLPDPEFVAMNEAFLDSFADGGQTQRDGMRAESRWAADEIDQWVIEAIKKIGLDTARQVLNAPREMHIEKADLEEETVDNVFKVLRAEFES